VFFAIFLFSNIPIFGIKIHRSVNILLVAYNSLIRSTYLENIAFIQPDVVVIVQVFLK
jgi:hypothetical protein